MLGITFIKVQPTDYVVQFKRGKSVREGRGLSFFCYAPATSLVLVPMGSVDVPFIFEEVTQDFQHVTLQGQLTYRIQDPVKLMQLMNFTLDASGKNYSSEDPKKLPPRLINQVHVLTRALLKSMPLRQALSNADVLVEGLRSELGRSEMLLSLGVEILGVSILAVKPTPETGRALEAQAREQILKEADDAIYARRNAAVEQERSVKENELNTEIAIELKKRQIRETQMDAKKSVQQKERELQEAEMAAKVALEEQKQSLVNLASNNARQEADTKAYGISSVLKALSDTDPKTLQALMSVGMEPGQMIALAFQELAAGAGKIGELNMSPDLLRELMKPEKQRG